MKLIDADNLDTTTITTDDYSGNEILDVVLKEDIDNEPPVPAIPIPEGTTNGDMIKILFPDGIPKDIMWTLQNDKGIDWWNKPYDNNKNQEMLWNGEKTEEQDENYER